MFERFILSFVSKVGKYFFKNYYFVLIDYDLRQQQHFDFYGEKAKQIYEAHEIFVNSWKIWEFIMAS